MIQHYYLNRILKLGVCCLLASCDASIPLADGTWLSSDRGTWGVNSSTITGFSSSLSASPTSTLTYMSHTGTLYLFNTSTSFLGFTVPFYICLDFQISTTSAPTFFIVTVFNSTVSDRFTDESSAACSNTGYKTANNRHVLIQQGAETSFTPPLPNVIRGEYLLNFTSVSGVTSDGITLDTCNNTSLMQFKSSGSSVQNVGFSSSGYLISLYSTQSDTITYLYTYNNDSSVDGSTTYRLVCWAISYSSFGVSASAYPGTCQLTQNATYTPTGGQLFSLTALATTEESSDINVTLIVIIVVCVVVVVVIIVVVVVIIVKKKHKRKNDVDDDDLKKGKTRDASVSTSVHSGDSSCIPWLGRGSKTVSTSTSDLNSITFYLPLKYTKRPGETDNPATKNKRPATGTLHRSKSEVSTISEHVEKDKTIKQPFRFVQYVGVVKKDTKTKAVVDTHWHTGTPNGIKNGKVSQSKPVTVQEEMSRAKTFHDFEREFDEKHKFPVTINKYDKWANTKRDEKPVVENKTTQNKSIGDTSNETKTKNKSRGIIRVRSQEELDSVNDDERVDETEKSANDKRVYFKRTRTIPGINYTSPYAMTREQKDYVAKRKAWVTMQHNHEKSKQKWLMELKKKESEKAYLDWVKYKTAEADKMRSSFRRTQSQPAHALENSISINSTKSQL